MSLFEGKKNLNGFIFEINTEINLTIHSNDGRIVVEFLNERPTVSFEKFKNIKISLQNITFTDEGGVVYSTGLLRIPFKYNWLD